jgi:hypothetical protein
MVIITVNKAIAWKMYQGENPIKQVKLPVLKNEKQRFLTDQCLRSEKQGKPEGIHDQGSEGSASEEASREAGRTDFHGSEEGRADRRCLSLVHENGRRDRIK